MERRARPSPPISPGTVDRSKELLRHKSIRLTDIALLVGFEDQSYYSKVFKKLEGITPLRFRESEGR